MTLSLLQDLDEIQVDYPSIFEVMTDLQGQTHHTASQHNDIMFIIFVTTSLQFIFLINCWLHVPIGMDYMET